MPRRFIQARPSRSNSSTPLIESLESRRLFAVDPMATAVGVAPSASVVAAAPSIPTVQGVTASPVSTTSIAISWTPSTYNDSDPDNSYHVYEIATGGGRTLVAAPGNTPNATVDGLEPGSTHVLAVTVLDSDGNESPLSQSVSVRTFAPSTLADPNPDHVAIRIAAESPYSFTFTASANPPATYSIASGPAGATIDANSGLLSWTPTAAQIGPADFVIRAENEWGSDEATLSLTVAPAGSDLTPPSVVTGVVVSNPNRHGADVAWTAATDDAGVDHYRLRVYAESATSTLLLQVDTVGSGTSTMLNNAALTYNSTYQIKVTAVDAAGNESDLAATPYVPLSTAFVDVVKPTAPTNVTALDLTTSSVTLNWTAATDNIGVAGYRVYRRTVLHNPKGSGFTIHYGLLVDHISPNVTSATVSGLAQGTSYSMVVEAYDADGNAAKSAPAGFVTLAPATLYAATLGAIVAGQQTLSFYPSYTGTPKPDVSLVSGPDGMTVSVAPSGSAQVQWTPAASVAAGDYSFTLRAANSVSSVEQTYVLKVLASDTDITRPSTPTDFRVDAVTSTSADLSWSSSTDNVGVDHYSVHFFAQIGYRKQFGRTYTVPATADARTSTSVTGLVAGKSYSVTVIAIDAAGNSSFSLGGNVRTPAATPAAVQDVYVLGSSWTRAFKDGLALQADQDPGSATFGYLLSDWTGAGRSLPFVNLNTLALRFTGAVPAAAAAATMSVTSGGAAVGVSSVAVSPTDPTVLLVKLQQALPRGTAELTIAGVLDDSGRPVDVKINLVPGDADGDGKVGATDLVLTRNHLGFTTKSVDYDLFNDFNGDGVIDAADLVLVRNRI